MNELECRAQTFAASDGYPLHIARWPVAPERAKGYVVVLHGVQSHSGWYHRLGRTLAAAGYSASFPDRRGSGANQRERGHARSARRLILDLAEWLGSLRAERPELPIALAGISWGGKLVVVAAGRYPDLVDGIALICPGLHPRVGVTWRERLGIAWALLADRRKTFPIPLSDPALFTANPEGQAFIGADSKCLREATASLLAASTVVNLLVKRSPARIKQPALLMLAGQDRIVDNGRTLSFFQTLASTDKEVIAYPEGHHTLEFEPYPSRYALDLVGWLDRHLPDRRMKEMHHGTDQA
jgi:alpha-beta hydrolase superfamily lysophospholipase